MGGDRIYTQSSTPGEALALIAEVYPDLLVKSLCGISYCTLGPEKDQWALVSIRKPWKSGELMKTCLTCDITLGVIISLNASFTFGKVEGSTINGINALVFRDFVWSTTSGIVKMDRLDLWILSLPDLDLFTKLFRREDVTENLKQILLLNIKDYVLDG